jgi:RimJ/RimL family protein N-acetyltransferase
VNLSPGRVIHIRKAQWEDSAFLLQVRNQPSTRQNSFSQGLVSESDHEAWFSKKLRDDKTWLYLGEIQDLQDKAFDTGTFENESAGVEPRQPLGQVRFDLQVRCDLNEPPFSQSALESPSPEASPSCSVEVSISLDERFQGQGLGSVLLQRACHTFWAEQGAVLAGGDKGKLHCIAHIRSENQASVKIFSKAGFLPAGTVVYQGTNCLEMILTLSKVGPGL